MNQIVVRTMRREKKRAICLISVRDKLFEDMPITPPSYPPSLQKRPAHRLHISPPLLMDSIRDCERDVRSTCSDRMWLREIAFHSFPQLRPARD